MKKENVIQSTTNAMTMPTGQYGVRHIARWSVSVASCKAPKRRQPPPGECSCRIGPADAMVVVIVVTTNTQNATTFS